MKERLENIICKQEVSKVELVALFPAFVDMLKCTQNNPHHCYTLGEHTLKTMENVSNTPLMRCAALLHDYGKLETKKEGEDGFDHFYKHAVCGLPFARTFLAKMGYEEDFINEVLVLIEYHDVPMHGTNIKKFLKKYPIELLREVMELKYADINAQHPTYQKVQKIAWCDDSMSIIERMCS